MKAAEPAIRRRLTERRDKYLSPQSIGKNFLF